MILNSYHMHLFLDFIGYRANILPLINCYIVHRGYRGYKDVHINTSIFWSSKPKRKRYKPMLIRNKCNHPGRNEDSIETLMLLPVALSLLKQ